MTERRPRRFEKALPGLGRRNTPGRTAEQHDPELLLELSDRLTRCRPGDTELPRGTAEAPQPRDREEHAEMGKRGRIHPGTSIVGLTRHRRSSGRPGPIVK